jgi:hypothetical protein
MTPRQRILPPYTQMLPDLRHRLGKIAAFSGLVFAAVLLGFTIAILPVQLVVIPILPLLVLLAIMLWLAPDIDPDLDGQLRTLFLTFIFFQLFWPHYIAFVAPGLGFVTPTRLAMFALVGVGLWAIATSKRLRSVIADSMNGAPIVKWAFIGLFVLQLILVVVWNQFSSRWFNAQIFWYFAFLISVAVCAFEGVPRRVAILILIAVPWLSYMGFWEYQNMRKIWMPWVPPFMRGDPELWFTIIEGQIRAGTDRYRASGVLLTSVTLGEFMAISIPFVTYFALGVFKGWWRFFSLFFVITLAVGIWSTGSRTAFVGLISGMAVFGLLWGLRRWKTMGASRDLLGPAALWAYPAAAVAVAAAVLFVPRIRRLVLGGSEHENSDNAREVQWGLTWDAVQRNPFGYGPFTAGRVIGYQNAAGKTTTDGYYMNLLADYGVLGALLFTAIFGGAAWYAARTYLRAATPDEEVGGPLAASLVTFIITKFVLSQPENHPLMFALAGMAVAIFWRQTVRLRLEKAPVAPRRTPPLRAPRPAAGAALALRGGRTA